MTHSTVESPYRNVGQRPRTIHRCKCISKAGAPSHFDRCPQIDLPLEIAKRAQALTRALIQESVRACQTKRSAREEGACRVFGCPMKRICTVRKLMLERVVLRRLTPQIESAHGLTQHQVSSFSRAFPLHRVFTQGGFRAEPRTQPCSDQRTYKRRLGDRHGHLCEGGGRRSNRSDGGGYLTCRDRPSSQPRDNFGREHKVQGSCCNRIYDPGGCTWL